VIPFTRPSSITRCLATLCAGPVYWAERTPSAVTERRFAKGRTEGELPLHGSPMVMPGTSLAATST